MVVNFLSKTDRSIPLSIKVSESGRVVDTVSQEDGIAGLAEVTISYILIHLNQYKKRYRCSQKCLIYKTYRLLVIARCILFQYK